MKNWLIKKMGGFTSSEVTEGYKSVGDYNKIETNNKLLKNRVDQKVEVIETLKYDKAELERIKRKLNSELTITKTQAADQIQKIQVSWDGDKAKLLLIKKDYDIQKAGYSRTRTRITKANNLLKDIEFKSTKGIGIKWLNYNSYKILGDDLLKVTRILTGGADSDKRPSKSPFSHNQKR